MNEEVRQAMIPNADATALAERHGSTRQEHPLDRHETEPREEPAVGTWPVSPTVATSLDETGASHRATDLAIAFGVFLLSFVPRIYVLFFVTDPQNPGLGWYGDTFHHWQIAYLSKAVGFSHGFLRLWDFKGMEYFWGLLHPVFLDLLFTVTGSVDVVILRLVSVVGASASIAVLMLLLRRYFNAHVAAAAVLLAALNPVAVFNDTVGMQEPLGLVLLFTGLWLWPQHSAWTGMLWAAAGMVRAEYWVFGAGLCAVAMLAEQPSHRKMALWLGWGLPSLLYMKYLLDHTGNPIYPIYWNFLGGTVGVWMQEAPLTPDRVLARWGARVALTAALGIAAWLLWKRPKSYLLLLLGIGNITMLGLTLGVGAYIHGYTHRLLVDRLFVVPYMYLGIFMAILLLNLLPKVQLRRLWLSVGWGLIVAVLAASQWAWAPIRGYYEPLNGVWQSEVRLAAEVAAVYQGGTISIPEDRPGLTYALVRYHGISGNQLEGQMYDPFAYFEGDPFADWFASRVAIVDWLQGHDIRLLVFYTGKANYEEMIRREPQMFRFLDSAYNGAIQIYEVTSG